MYTTRLILEMEVRHKTRLLEVEALLRGKKAKTDQTSSLRDSVVGKRSAQHSETWSQSIAGEILKRRSPEG